MDSSVRGLYPILDPDAAPPDLLLGRLPALREAGARIVQVRVKTGGASRLLRFALAVRERAGSLGMGVVVNDRPDVAMAMGAPAPGVHVGQQDLPVAAVRGLTRGLVGLSTHDLRELGAASAARGPGRPDYAGFGPIFPTGHREMAHAPHGLEGLRRAVGESSLPVVAIGGIGSDRVPEVLATGVAAVAVIGAISGPEPELRRFLSAFRGASS